MGAKHGESEARQRANKGADSLVMTRGRAGPTTSHDMMTNGELERDPAASCEHVNKSVGFSQLHHIHSRVKPRFSGENTPPQTPYGYTYPPWYMHTLLPEYHR